MYSKTYGDNEEKEVPGEQFPDPVPDAVPPERKKAPESESPGEGIFGDERDGRSFTMSLGRPGDWEKQAGMMMSKGRSTLSQAVENAKGFQFNNAAAATLGRMKMPSVPVRPRLGVV